MNGFIIDLDGTLHRGKEPIPYAASFIQMLQAKKLPFLLVTNNSSRTPLEVAHHLLHFEIEVTAEQIYTSAQAAAAYITEQPRRNAQPASAFIIGENGLRTALEESGITFTQDNPDYVVQGIDREFNYNKLATAIRLIRAGSIFIQTNPDLLLPSDNGFIPGSGTLAASIIAGSGAEPVLIGKPSALIMQGAIARLGCLAQDVWVIGDNISTDIRGGIMSGCKTALVLTGVATVDNVQEQISRAGVAPDLICSNLRDFASKILQA